jgi:DNA-binding MarR family transcriptional regulator
VPTDRLAGDTLELAARLRAAVVPLARSLRQQSGGRLTATQASVLGTVMRHGPVSLSAIAVREQLSLPMVSKVTGALEAEGLVLRSSDPADARVSLVDVSDAGRAWIEETRRRRDQWLAGRLADTDADERAALAKTIATFERILEDPS